MRLCVETWNVAAITPQVSPERTTYSNGGNGVSVGIDVAVGISVPVGVIVAVVVAVPAGVGSVSVAFVRPDFSTKETVMAPTKRMITSAPNAAGKLRVISGIRLACTVVFGFLDFLVAFPGSFVP